MKKRSLFLPPAPQLKEQADNRYKYLYSGFENVNQVHISEEPSIHAKRFHDLENLLEFKIIRNDHTKMSLIYLIAARNLVGECLTNMPGTYITHLIYNELHTTISAYIKNTSRLASCVTFRNFYQRGFSELVFCVVQSENQITGVGANIIAHFKEYLQVVNIRHIVVYADNSAIGFFEKQGFSKKIGIPKEVYDDYIGHYDGATLMYARVDPYYNYVSHPDFTESIQKIIAATLEPPRIVRFKIFPVPEILGMRIEPKASTSVKEVIQMIFEKTVSHSSSNLFKKLVPKEDYPDYYKAVKHPMCFEIIERKLKSGKYQKIEDLISDLSLIIENVFSYEDIEVKYKKNALILQSHIQEILMKLHK